MRHVRFNKWIPKIAEKREYCSKPKEGTACWEKDFPNEGMFHQWGFAYEEFESGAGNYTVAIVELNDGTITEVLPSNVKFLYPTE